MFDPAQPFFQTVYVVGLTLGCAIRLRSSRQTAEMSNIVDAYPSSCLIPSFMLPLGMFVLPFVSILTPWLDFADYTRPEVLGWSGVVIFPVALWLLWWTHQAFGQTWPHAIAPQDEQELLTQGVYRYIRHPMYAAYILWGIAQFLLLPNWLAGPALLLIFLIRYRSQVDREEQLLLAFFGKDYQEYMARTGRLIPRLRSGPP